MFQQLKSRRGCWYYEHETDLPEQRLSSAVKVTPWSSSGVISSFTAWINSYNVVFIVIGSERTVSDKDKYGAISCICFSPVYLQCNATAPFYITQKICQAYVTTASRNNRLISWNFFLKLHQVFAMGRKEWVSGFFTPCKMDQG